VEKVLIFELHGIIHSDHKIKFHRKKSDRGYVIRHYSTDAERGDSEIYNKKAIK